jgi:hypothetical protein
MEKSGQLPICQLDLGLGRGGIYSQLLIVVRHDAQFSPLHITRLPMISMVVSKFMPLDHEFTLMKLAFQYGSIRSRVEVALWIPIL